MKSNLVVLMKSPFYIFALSQLDYVSGSVCFGFVFLCVCYQHCSKCYKPIVIRFYGGVRGGKRKKLALAEVCGLRLV